MSDAGLFLALIPTVFVGFVLMGRRPSSILLVFSVLVAWLGSGVYTLIALVMF